MGGKKGLFGSVRWTLGLLSGKLWKGHLGVRGVRHAPVTGALVLGAGVRGKIWQSVGFMLFSGPPGGVTASFPVGKKNANQETDTR